MVTFPEILKYLNIKCCLMRSSSIHSAFYPLSLIASTLGIYPVAAGVNVSHQHECLPRFKWISWRTLYCVICFLIYCVILFQTTPEYIKQNVDRTVTHPTDAVCFVCFISLVVAIRMLCYLFVILKSKEIVIVLNAFHKYDKQFGENENAQKGPFGIHFFILFIGSIISLMGSFEVIRPDFETTFANDGPNSTWIVSYLTSNPAVATDLIFVAHIWCEIGFVFLMTTFVFFVQNFTNRLKTFEREIVGYFKKPEERIGQVQWKNTVLANQFKIFELKAKKNEILPSASDRFRDLINVNEKLGNFSASFVLIYISLSLCFVIVSTHLLTFTLKFQEEVQILGTEVNIFSIHQGAFAIAAALAVAAIRVFVLINIGEQMERKGDELLLSITLIDKKGTNNEETKQLQDICQMASNHKFRIGACGFFDLNRRLIISMASSIVSFIVVLAQFRSN